MTVAYGSRRNCATRGRPSPPHCAAVSSHPRIGFSMDTSSGSFLPASPSTPLSSKSDRVGQIILMLGAKLQRIYVLVREWSPAWISSTKSKGPVYTD